MVYRRPVNPSGYLADDGRLDYNLSRLGRAGWFNMQLLPLYNRCLSPIGVQWIAHLLLALVGVDGYNWFCNLIEEQKEPVGIQDFVTFLKTVVTPDLKRGRRPVGRVEWWKLAEIEAVFGYAPSDWGEESLEESIRDWLFEGSKNIPAWTEDGVLRELKTIVWKEFDVNDISLEAFLFKPELWLTEGVSNRFKLKAIRSKAAIMFSVSYKKLLNLLLTENEVPDARIIRKREAKGVRPVLGDDDIRYLMGRYLLHCLRYKGKVLTGFMGNEAVLQAFETVQHRLQAGNVPVSIDIAKFDNRWSTDFLRKAVSIVCERLKGHVMSSNGVSVGVQLISNFIAMGMNVRVDGKLSVSGLPSGHPWTALMGSLLNYSIARMVGRYSGIRSHGLFQGDDCAFVCKSAADCKTMAETYNKLFGAGFAHPDKTTIGIFEFLKRVVEPHRIHGYPVRTIQAKLWRSPLSVDSKVDRIDEISQRWDDSLSKGFDFSVCYAWCAVEIASTLNISPAQALNLMTTPSSVGGLGWVGDRGFWYKLVRETRPDDSDSVYVAQDSIASILGIRDKRFASKQLLVEQKVEPVPVKWVVPGGPLGELVRPAFDDKISIIALGDVNDEDLLDYVLKHVENSDVVRRMHNRLSFPVFKAWVSGTLGIPTPKGSGLDTLYVVRAKADLEKKFLRHLEGLTHSRARYSRIGMGLVRELELYYEMLLGRRLIKLQWGGTGLPTLPVLGNGLVVGTQESNQVPAPWGLNLDVLKDTNFEIKGLYEVGTAGSGTRVE